MTKSKDQSIIDLASLDTAAASNKGYEIQLVHPVKGLQPIFITVLGKDSTVAQEHARERVNDRLRKNFETQRKGKDLPVMTVEQVEKDAAELLAALTVSWRNVMLDGELLECTPANAKRIYLHPGYRWIKEQVDEAAADLANFMPD